MNIFKEIFVFISYDQGFCPHKILTKLNSNKPSQNLPLKKSRHLAELYAKLIKGLQQIFNIYLCVCAYIIIMSHR